MGSVTLKRVEYPKLAVTVNKLHRQFYKFVVSERKQKTKVKMYYLIFRFLKSVRLVDTQKSYSIGHIKMKLLTCCFFFQNQAILYSITDYITDLWIVNIHFSPSLWLTHSYYTVHVQCNITWRINSIDNVQLDESSNSVRSKNQTRKNAIVFLTYDVCLP